MIPRSTLAKAKKRLKAEREKLRKVEEKKSKHPNVKRLKEKYKPKKKKK